MHPLTHWCQIALRTAKTNFLFSPLTHKDTPNRWSVICAPWPSWLLTGIFSCSCTCSFDLLFICLFFFKLATPQNQAKGKPLLLKYLSLIQTTICWLGSKRSLDNGKIQGKNVKKHKSVLNLNIYTAWSYHMDDWLGEGGTWSFSYQNLIQFAHFKHKTGQH